jgi:putative transposase
MLNRCRERYHAALCERTYAYRTAGKAGCYAEQQRDLPEIAESWLQYQGIHPRVLQDVLLRLTRAFDRFFERGKNGEKPEFPGHNRSVSFPGFSRAKKRLALSRMGTLKLNVYRKVEGTSNTCTRKQKAGQWCGILSCEVAARTVVNRRF